MRKKNVFSTVVAFVTLGMSAGFSATGCSSDDDSGAAGTSGAGGSGARGGSAGSGGSTATIDCKAPTGIQQCKDEAFKQGSCEEVGGCACQFCCAELQACEADVGCTEIRKCAERTGCRGIPCYQDATCKSVIDANGSPTGIPSSLALALSNCIADPMMPKCPITKCGGSAGTGGAGGAAGASDAGKSGTGGTLADASPGG